MAAWLAWCVCAALVLGWTRQEVFPTDSGLLGLTASWVLAWLGLCAAPLVSMSIRARLRERRSTADPESMVRDRALPMADRVAALAALADRTGPDDALLVLAPEIRAVPELAAVLVEPSVGQLLPEPAIQQLQAALALSQLPQQAMPQSQL